MTLQRLIEDNFPHLRGHVVGRNYPPPPAAQAFAQFVQVFQMFAIVMLFFGNSVFGMLGVQDPPQWFKKLQDSKMMAFGCIFLVNSLAQNMMSTGAFEVEYNGELIFSKLQTKQMPSWDLIAAALSQRHT